MKKRREGRIRIALLYPNAYRVAMGNLGFHQVYHLFNEIEDVACERAVLDESSSRPRTIESGSLLADHDIIALSISYENDLAKAARILHRAGISLDPEERERAGSPLILAGGPVAWLNPRPLSTIADVIAVGEAEALINPFLEAFRNFPGREPRERRELYHGLASRPGFYVPSLYEPTLTESGELKPLAQGLPTKIKRVFADPRNHPPARTRVFTQAAEFSDMALVELMRGCPHACRFCAAGWALRPPRFFPLEQIQDALKPGLEQRDRAGLVASSATDHPDFHRLRKWVREQGKTHSVASLRLEQLSEELLEDMVACGHRTITIAPEAGTERLRRIINKPLSDESLDQAMEMIGRSGISRVKMYFQIGLPFENAEDLEGIVSLVRRARETLARAAGKRKWPGTLSLSINPFVPKPWTPFYRHRMEGEKELRAKLELLRRGLREIPGVTVSGESPRQAWVQYLISQGGPEAGRVIAAAVQEGMNPEPALLRAWKKGKLESMDPDERSPENSKAGRGRPRPWAFIDHGFPLSYLDREWGRAASGKITRPCRPGKCKLCPACDNMKTSAHAE